ncbi:Uncharacterised protein [Bordetella pertussis]|nr:Uncharacterised protein [Bordetella pertussis]
MRAARSRPTHMATSAAATSNASVNSPASRA